MFSIVPVADLFGTDGTLQEAKSLARQRHITASSLSTHTCIASPASGRSYLALATLLRSGEAAQKLYHCFKIFWQLRSKVLKLLRHWMNEPELLRVQSWAFLLEAAGHVLVNCMYRSQTNLAHVTTRKQIM